MTVDARPRFGTVEELLEEARSRIDRLTPAQAHEATAQASHRWIVLCTEGYTSSLAAASLRSLGLDAADVDGGIRAWRRAGLPIAAGPTPVETVVQPDHLPPLPQTPTPTPTP